MKHPRSYQFSSRLMALLAAAFVLGTARGGEPSALVITHAWSPPTAAGRPVGVAYLSIINNGKKADALTSANTPIAESVQIHQTTMSDGMARMRPLEEVVIAPGKTVKVEPNGIHFMLMGLKGPLVAGTSVPLTLEFRDAGRIKVQLRIEERDAASAAEHSAH